MERTRREFIKRTAAAGAMFGAVGAAATDAAQARHNITLPTPRFKALMEMFGLKYPIFQAPPRNQPGTCHRCVERWRNGRARISSQSGTGARGRFESAVGDEGLFCRQSRSPI
jgi:hypothetical protein